MTTPSCRPTQLLAGLGALVVLAGCTGPSADRAPSPGPRAPTATATESTAPTPAPDATPSNRQAPAIRDSPPPDAPAFTGAGTLLVTGADGSVTRVDPASRDGVPLDEVTVATQVTPSEDGSSVVFTELGGDQPSVSVRRDGTSTSIPMPTAPYFHMVSPDGELIASLGDAPEGGAVTLLMIDPVAGTSAEVDRGRPYYLAWHPDGQHLAVHVDGTVLTLVDPDGTRTPIHVEPGAFQAPAWTGDGRLVVVLGSAGADALPVAASLAQQAEGVLAVVDPADDTTTELAEVTGAVSFDVAGDRVAWVAGTSGPAASLGPLEVIDVDGTGHTTIINASVAMFEWSPAGDRLLFQVLDPDRGFVPHVWDGTTVVAYEPFIPTPTLATQYLPFWPQYALSITQWAPDGTAFALAAAGTDGAPGTVVVQGLDGTRTEVGPGEMVAWSP